MDFDIAVIGAGPAGLSFACSLRNTNLKIAVIEKLSKAELSDPPIDGRDIALTHLSRKLMQQNGSWERVGVDNISPIKRAEVIDGDSPYTLSFNTPDDGTDALGFLISNHLIRKSIYAEFETLDNVTLFDNSTVTQVDTDEHCGAVTLEDGQSITAALLIAADTRFSNTRRQVGISSDAHDFGRTAIVCWMEHEISHSNTAFECFHYGRTLAVLPMPGNKSSIVITVPSHLAKDILKMSEYSYNEDIEERLKGRLGKMKQVGKRYTYPLVGVHANQFYKQRIALIGDAAVGMHPVTAHGFNLGLSGQDLLAKGIINALENDKDFWSETVLKQYQREHMVATRVLYHGTNSIVGLFTNDSLPATLIRKAALRASNNIPPIKWLIEQKLMAKNHFSQLLPAFLR
ncbi:MAG: 5-demethoxyubiquinol-8 5-hydroxylase UbiM [Gammaproteobacteria bacterium]|nr:5-demethoxyubiquinol-8 5-hydroxylase UbiM [Gammaproteobacteria bacterium]